MRFTGTENKSDRASMEEHKYILSEDRTRLVLKDGFTARLGIVVYTPTHDVVKGFGPYEDVEICLRDFRRGVDGGKAKESFFPRFLKDFADMDIADLCRRNNHCNEARSELVELIELSKKYEKEVIRRASCGSYCARSSADQKPLYIPISPLQA